MSDPNDESIDTELPAPADGSGDDDDHCCVVCLAEPQDVRLCKQCAHLFCRNCLETSYRTSHRCPHCRGNFDLDAYVRVPWISDLLKTVRSLPPKIAHECVLHSRKYLVNHCNDCDESCCPTCWADTHANHNVRSIEEANRTKREELRAVLCRLRDHAKGLVQSRRLYRENRQSHAAWFLTLKNEGDALVEECPSQMKEKWNREMARMRSLEGAINAALRRAHAVATAIKSTAADPHLNCLVDEFRFLRMEAERVTRGKKVADVLAFYESIHDRDVLEYFLPYLPGWDVKETVTVKNCKRLLTSSDQRCVAEWTVSGITWSLWIANRSRHGESTAEMRLVEQLSIYVTMTGRKELGNYALRLDKVQQNASINDPPVRTEIVCRNTVREGEKMYFPLGSPGKWISGAGHLVVVFKVRPLTYRQKCFDLEIYSRSLLGSKSSQDNVEVTAVEDSSRTSGIPESTAILPEPSSVEVAPSSSIRPEFWAGTSSSIYAETSSPIQPEFRVELPSSIYATPSSSTRDELSFSVQAGTDPFSFPTSFQAEPSADQAGNFSQARAQRSYAARKRVKLNRD